MIAEIYFLLLEQTKANKLRHTKTIPRHDYVLGAPKASGIRSMLYFLLLMNMIGTPGILRIFRFKSLSQVATM